jgi:hypothetical protein
MVPITDGDPKLEAILAKARELAIPVIVLSEYPYGIAQSRNRVRYERWLKELIGACRVLPVDEGTASEYASIRGLPVKLALLLDLRKHSALKTLRAGGARLAVSVERRFLIRVLDSLGYESLRRIRIFVRTVWRSRCDPT